MNFILRCCGCSVVAIAVCLFPVSVRGNDTCFLRGANGQLLDLGHLCSRSPAPPAKGVRLNFYQIPIKQRFGNIPSIEVIINGKYPVEMLFDTGASAIVINQAIAEKIGVFYGRDQVMVHTAGGMVASPVGYLNSMQAGQLLLKKVEVIVAPGLGEISGLVGQPFFANYDITIKEKVIELRAR